MLQTSVAYSNVIGIDPGKSGAITIIAKEGTLIVYDMPTIKEGKKGKETVDIIALSYIFKGLPKGSIAYLETQHALTRFDPTKGKAVPQGAVSNFTLGRGFGAVLMGLAMADIPFEEVQPKEWQKYFRIGGDKTKEQSHGVATRLFPGLEYTTPRGRLLDGRCDSVLIAEFGRRRLMGVPKDAEDTGDNKLSKPGRRAIPTRSKRS